MDNQNNNLKNTGEEKRESFTGNLGFILACVGGAIGLGNIWMFPWRLGKYGGGSFLLVYLVMVFVLGSIGLVSESALGRSQKNGTLGAFVKIFKEKKLPFGSFFGWIPIIAQIGVFIFYVVVVGWIFKYFFMAITGALYVGDIPANFGTFVGTPATIPWHLLAMVVALIIVKLGIVKGIEKVNKFMMPALFFMFVILLVKTLSLPGSMEGMKYLLIPDWSYLSKPITYIMALGQAFFTVGLGGASMVVYGSYLKKDIDLPSAAVKTVAFDTLAALLAAFVIIPAAFSFGLDPAAGPPLLFITVPFIFQSMSGGYLFGIIFFTTIVFAAVSSVINLMEVAVEAVMYRLKWNRNKSVFLVAALGFLVGIPLDLNMNLLGMTIDIVTVYLVPIGALLAAILMYWIYGADKALEEINLGAKKPLGNWMKFAGKYLFTFTAIFVLILALVNGAL
jgi:NSS family neurotransmitter:Na+ symporter